MTTTFEHMQSVAAQTHALGRELNFTQLDVTASRRRSLGVRIAQNAVCRENVWREQLTFNANGHWDGRQSNFVCPAMKSSELQARLRDLRQNLTLQSADKEYVAARHITGKVQWQPQTADFEATYPPEAIYAVIAKHCARAEAQGLRVTGFVEAQHDEAEHQVMSAAGDLSLGTSGHAVTLSFTVDNQKTGVVGTTSRASLLAPPPELDRLIGEALDEATRTCMAGPATHAIEAGDYTVVLHPAAVADIVQMPLVYGFYDQRKIDEGRTFLSGKIKELAFPAGLSLTQTLNLQLGALGYADLPLNDRHVPCTDLALIRDGRIGELYRAAYWAQKCGQAETFSAGGGPPLTLDVTPGSAMAGKHKTLQDLIASTERGIYVANMWYLRLVTEMDGVLTGMTRDGLFEIKDGKITRPLINMRWHENLLTALTRITGVTDDRHLAGRPRLAGGSRGTCLAVPALRIDGFHFSSATKF